MRSATGPDRRGNIVAAMLERVSTVVAALVLPRIADRYDDQDDDDDDGDGGGNHENEMNENGSSHYMARIQAGTTQGMTDSPGSAAASATSTSRHEPIQ